MIFLRANEGDEWPDLSDTALTKTVAEWLTPALAGKTALNDSGVGIELDGALAALLPWPLKRRLDAERSTLKRTTGSQVPIDYEAEGGPKISIRVQELFGLDRHSSIAGGKVPLLIELLSPAHRPVQMTRDLPGSGAAAMPQCARKCAAVSEASVARQPDRGGADAAGQTTGLMRLMQSDACPLMSCRENMKA